MKRKEIVLDFTSLLDVTLIVIFFFVLFSNLNEQAVKNEYETKRRSVEEKEVQVQKELDTVLQSDERQGENTNALIEFSRGNNIKIILKDPESKYVTIQKNSGLTEQIKLDDNFENKFETLFDKVEDKKNNTILCEFIYDGSANGSNSSYKRIKNILSKTGEVYTHLYVSETNTAEGE